MIRLAERRDLDAVTAIYDRIHTMEEQGRAVIGWVRDVYPTRATAEAALAAGDLYVLEEDGQVLASARINGEQVPEYALTEWEHPAPDDRILVLHTLTVDPAAQGRGIARRFVGFYEEMGRKAGRPFLRMDTNEKNAAARAMYKKLGYREVGIVPCNFNGIPGVQLVCLEKQV